MFKWVAGLCAAIYVTLLVVGAPPDEAEVVAEAAPVVEPAVEDVAVQQEAPTPEPVTTEQPVVLATASTAAVQPKTTDLAQQLPQVKTLTPPSVESASLDADTAEPVSTPITIEPVAQAPVAEVVATAVQEQPAQEPNNGVGEVWTVTGSRVNLRSGASTSFEVVGQTRRGDSAEVIDLLDNGWAHVYIIDLGVEAYMSADFISRDS